MVEGLEVAKYEHLVPNGGLQRIRLQMSVFQALRVRVKGFRVYKDCRDYHVMHRPEGDCVQGYMQV